MILSFKFLFLYKVLHVWQKIKKYKEVNYLRWNLFTLTGILLIIICGIKATWNLKNYMDLLFWDESIYLNRGTQMFHFIPRDWGPTYSLWYKILSLFISDKVDLYYFNFKLTTILLSISFFLLMLACGVQRVLAFIFAVFSLSTFINLPIWPHISHFCVILIITAVIIAKYQQTYTAKLAILSFALMGCSYARPELFLAFLPILLLTYLFFFVNIKQNTKKDIILVVALTLLSLLVYRFFRTPFNNGDSQRSVGVFVQHFALNYSKWYPSKSPFWLDFFDVFNKEFKDATPTLFGLYEKNPELIQKHFLSNISFYFIQLGKIIFSFFAPIFTKQTHWLTLMICIMLFIVYFSFTKSLQNTFKRLYVLLYNNFFTLTVLGVFAIPSVIVCIYAYPRDHYLLIQVPFLLLIVSLFVSSIQVTIVKPIQKIIVVATIWFFVMPAAEDFDYFSFNRFNYYSATNDYANLPNLTTIKYIKKNLLTKDTVCIFDVEGGIANLLSINYTNNLYKWKKDSVNLSSFILSSPDIDMVYYTPTMTNLNCTQNDTTLFNLFKHPEQYGYYKQKTGNFKQFLLIKRR